MSDRPTIYESAARRRRRRIRAAAIGALFAVLLVAALAIAAEWVRDGGEGAAAGTASHPPATSASATAPALRLSGLARVEVHRGETATIRYRLGGPAGAETSVTLVVTDAAGRRVKARRLLDAAMAGEWLAAAVPIDLEPGRYTYELRLGDAGAPAVAGSPSPRATASIGRAPITGSASLVVLPPLPPGFPGKKAVAAAKDWIAGRDGDVAFAVVDTNGEEAGGYRVHEPFQLASLSKAIMLVASLRDDPTPDPTTEATLTKMITESDNGAAYAIYAQVGSTGMRAVAKAAGLRDYEQGSGWVDTRASAWDEARLFSRLETLVPAAGRGLARRLLSSVIPIQRWGIPAAAGPEGWTSYFKGGWLGLDNKLMVQAAWLEKGKKRWALAVMSDEDPTRSYGWDTQKGVTGLLLGQEPTAAYLAVVLE
jgi:Beta-lactamase enzyme family